MRMQLVAAAATASLVAASAAGSDAQCLFQHPSKAPEFRVYLVPAFVCCYGNGGCLGGGDSADRTALGGNAQACFPQTFNEVDGGPQNGWLWGPTPKSSSRSNR